MKKLLAVFLFILFNGCVQGTAFIGPAVTVASTGNVYQAGISYGSNLAIQNVTGKTMIENIKEILEPDKGESKITSLVKKKITETTKINDLSSQ